MLILFHYITILIYQILRHRKRIKCLHAEKENYNHMICNNKYMVHIRPEVQKYRKLFQLLEDKRWKDKIEKLVDLGSGNLSIIYTLLEVANLNQILLVDINEELLRKSISSLDPHVYLPHLNKRYKPLDISILAGNVVDSDYRLLRTDAITAVNLLESLYPDALDALPYNIFTFIEPKIVIFITSISTSLSDISRQDRRSMWTRQQFEDWSNNMKIRFPDYNCHFEMIQTPKKTDFSWLHISEISEVALFLRRDLVDPKYILTSSSTQCLCRMDSPCRIISSSSKMLCHCVCPLCCPSSSFGVCNYHSSTKKATSLGEDENCPANNPDFNIYYKVVAHSILPCEDEDDDSEEDDEAGANRRTEEQCGDEKGEGVKTRYLDATGGFTERELLRILLEQDYKFEECRFEKDWKSLHHYSECPTSSRTCDMEEITSNTETPEYDSDCVKEPAPKDSPSDWEESGEKKLSDVNESSSAAKDISAPETSSKAEAPDQKQDALVDSGYQKSPSPIEDSPFENSEENDIFEETTSTPSVDSDDNKVHMRRASGSIEKPHLPPLQADFTKFKLDMNRINELDKFHNIPPGRTFFNHMLKSQDATRRSFLKDRELPGPSNVPLSPRKRKKHKKPLGAESEEESPFDDCKSITNCLIKNTLNKLEVNDADEQRNIDRDDVIEFNVEPEVAVVEAWEPEALVVEIAEQEMAILEQGVAQHQDVVPEVLPAGLVVENGDLANNNRDIEGNNYIAPENQEIVENDIENFNLVVMEDIPEVHLVQEIVNVNDIADNNNHNAEDLHVIEDPAVLVEGVGENENDQNNAQQAEQDQPEPAGVARASREALFDPNSEVDLLEDVDLPILQEEPTAMEEIGLVDVIEYGNNIVLIGVLPNLEDQDAPVDVNAFPRWLLQILGAQVGQNEEDGIPDASEDPHFYCQGDGLGNNYIAPENQEIVENDIENFNLVVMEDIPEVHLVQEIVNVNDIADNNNHNAEDLHVIEDPAVLVEGVGENENDQNNAQQAEQDQPEPAGVARASREALFDPNSEVDLLEDVDLPILQEEPTAMEEIGLVDVIEYGNNIVLIGVLPNLEDQDAPVDVNAFPRWLLQILGAQVGQNEEDGIPDASEDPHFYCQGDGLGIHPSVVAVDVNEDEESTQSSNTGEYADVEQDPSSQDASSLPEESQPLVELENNADDDVVAVEPTTSQQTEFFDSDPGEQTDGT